MGDPQADAVGCGGVGGDGVEVPARAVEVRERNESQQRERPGVETPCRNLIAGKRQPGQRIDERCRDG
jgi:hypothetical protein